MQELTFIAPGRVEWREKLAPRITGPGQALVRPLAVSRCDLDFIFATGRAPIEGPFGLGHETVAEVVDVSEDVRGVAVGDRAIVPFQISCGSCAACKRGRTGSCSSVPKLAAYGLGPLFGGDYGGALCDLLHVPFADAMLVRIERSVDPVAAAALGDNAVDGYRTVAEPLAREPGAAVLVAGGGAPSVALYAVAAARALGVKEVVYVDPSEARGSIAGKLGARVVQAKAEPGLRVGRFPITVDATSREEGLRFCLASTAAWGECTSVGIYLSDVALPLLDMYTRGVRFITGRADARRDLPGALALFAAGRFDLEQVASRVVPWAEAPSAWLEPAPKLIVRR
jgi:threonine dehydrogenase-like Zn-dependent dehydrogenase